MSGQDLLFVFQHPEQLLHKELTWEEAGRSGVPAPLLGVSEVQEVCLCLLQTEPGALLFGFPGKNSETEWPLNILAKQQLGRESTGVGSILG